MNKNKLLENLSGLFGSYKAEWLQDMLFELYSEPSYFPELCTPRPCVLYGGRGTGKTTVLRSLSYEGLWEITKRSQNNEIKKSRKIFRSNPYYGFYYRVNTPRVSAFQGVALKKREWQSLFMHYINVIFAQQVISFLIWFSKNIDLNFQLPAKAIVDLCNILALDIGPNDLGELNASLSRALLNIEMFINNADTDKRPRLSSPGAMDALFSTLTGIRKFRNKTFFLIIDEYENFSDIQQQAINTLIKHTNTAFTFKIGVRQLGWRVKNTLNENEYLSSPADYVLIDIADKLSDADFNKFAEKICTSRVIKLFGNETSSFISIADLFPSLNNEEESILLGVNKLIAPLRGKISKSKDDQLISFANGLTDLELYIIHYSTHSSSSEFLAHLSAWKSQYHAWSYRFDEYKYAALFSIAHESGRKKFYNGWDVLSKLANKNIRYLLQLVEQSLLLHLKEGETIGDKISPKTQSIAAASVGRKNFEELQGLSTHGAKLTKLVLSLGRIFNLMARDSAGHAHEVNQFRVTDQLYLGVIGKELEREAKEILDAATMHLALIAFPGNKPKTEGDTKSDTYQLHPIFSAYFHFSYRKRRHMVLRPQQLLDLANNPSEAIKSVLAENNRFTPNSRSQLSLFDKTSDADV